MSFKEIRDKSIRALRDAGTPPKGRHWSFGNGGRTDGVLVLPRKTIASKGGLVVHRLTDDNDVGPTRGRYAILDRESGLSWLVVGHRGLAVSIVKRHGVAWVDLMREACDGESPNDEPRSDYRTRILRRLAALAEVYRRGDPGEDDGGVAYDVEDPSPDETLGEAATFGLGIGSSFRGPIFVLSRKSDGSPRSWARETSSGWARFDAGARDEDDRRRHDRTNKGRSDVLVREFKSLRSALTAAGYPKIGDVPPRVALLKFDAPNQGGPAATPEDFRREYEAALKRLVEKNPDDYAYSAEHVPRVAEKMIRALAEGGANIGDAAKAVAKKCGIRPTAKAIRVFLSS